MHIRHINPEGLFKSPAFSQAVITQGQGKTIYIGGQNAVNNKIELQGKGDLAVQTTQAMENVQTALEACGASFSDVVKMNICVVQGQDIRKGFEASQKFFSGVKNPPAITVVFVSALGQPDYLVEIDAVAFVAAKDDQ